MQRADFLNSCAAIAGTPFLASAPPAAVSGIAIPDTQLARDATSVARASEPPEIFNHSLRAYLFAELIAAARKLPHDAEAVYVAAILHDTGLTPAHMSASDRFEVDGANLSRAVLRRNGVAGVRADLIWDAITLHDAGDIARWKGVEVMLVNAGVSADFGAGLDRLPRDDVTAVLAAAPRTNFIPVFLDAVAAVARSKPRATGNCFVTDVAYRMVPGFHLANFCDQVKVDPFTGYV